MYFHSYFQHILFRNVTFIANTIKNQSYLRKLIKPAFIEYEQTFIIFLFINIHIHTHRLHLHAYTTQFHSFRSYYVQPYLYLNTNKYCSYRNVTCHEIMAKDIVVIVITNIYEKIKSKQMP